MKENKYDEASFFEQYGKMSPSQKGLDGAGEWHVLKEMLPDFKGTQVLDLGCGYGWHCRYAIEKGAVSAIGIYKDTHVVVYDHAAGANAASRFWWMLKAIGNQKIQVLSGGFEYAESKGFPISEGESASTRGTDYTLDTKET